MFKYASKLKIIFANKVSITVVKPVQSPALFVLIYPPLKLI